MSKRTPLYDTHRALGARIVPFAGFDMPVQYTSILDEHAAVRNAAGLFDVSHMGEIHLTGPGAVASVGLRCESAVIVALAARLTTLLRRGDPLATRVKLRKGDFAAALVRGVWRGLVVGHRA